MSPAQRATYVELCKWCNVTLSANPQGAVAFTADSRDKVWKFGGFIALNGNLENVGNLPR